MRLVQETIGASDLQAFRQKLDLPNQQQRADLLSPYPMQTSDRRQKIQSSCALVADLVCRLQHLQCDMQTWTDTNPASIKLTQNCDLLPRATALFNQTPEFPIRPSILDVCSSCTRMSHTAERLIIQPLGTRERTSSASFCISPAFDLCFSGVRKAQCCIQHKKSLREGTESQVQADSADQDARLHARH